MSQVIVTTKPLFDMHITLKDMCDFGESHVGRRLLFDVKSGYFEGQNIKGVLRESGGDWMLQHPDGSFTLDVRLTLVTEDDAFIYMNYRGRMVIPDEMKPQVLTSHLRQERDKEHYYLRTLIMFETASSKYQYLNEMVAVAHGYLTQAGVSYHVMEVL